MQNQQGNIYFIVFIFGLPTSSLLMLNAIENRDKAELFHQAVNMMEDKSFDQHKKFAHDALTKQVNYIRKCFII